MLRNMNRRAWLKKRDADKRPSASTTQVSITQAFTNATQYEKDSRRWKEITNAISNYVAKDMAPLSTVEHSGFRHLIKTLDRRYTVPSRTYFSQTALPNMYKTCRIKVATELKSVQHFAATSDLWSSRTMEPYLSLAVHYIDDEWKLRNRCLDTAYFPVDHTSEMIAQGLRDMMSAWELGEENLVAITTDNGANVVKATQLNGWTRQQCFGHRLHLAIAQLNLDLSTLGLNMSQITLLEEVAKWSQDTCRQELKSVLPKLTFDSWDKHIRILRIITDLFLPHLGLSELEEECFSKILPKAVNMFASLMKEISSHVEDVSSQTTDLRSLLRNILQAMVQIIEAMSACVRHVCSFEEAPYLAVIRSLPSCVLKVLRDSFEHCKNSETVYCGRLSLVADLLQALFKEAYTLQKGLMELLDRVCLDGNSSEEDITDIVTVIHSLLDICCVISSLDVALHASTWKFIIKQSVKYQSMVEEHLCHADISAGLCENLLASFHNCLELAEQIKQTGLQEMSHNPEYKLFLKTSKMCRFLANTLVHYIKEFHAFLVKYSSRFHQLYLQIISMFPPSLCAPGVPPPFFEELNIAALVPMDALLSQLLPLLPFAEEVLRLDLLIRPQWQLPHCLLLVSVLAQLASQPEEVLHFWYQGSQFSEETPRMPLYQAVFTSFRRCCTERRVPVVLPGVMLKGHAQGKVSLHQLVCVQLCASVATLPPEHFYILERCLLAAVLQPDVQTALLATDVWCFMARYGTAELCLHHVLIIAHLVKTCPGECYQLSHLGLLLRRMVFLTTPSHQMELLEHFPPSQVKNLAMWRHIFLRALCIDACQRVETDILSLTQKALADWQNGGHKLEQVDTVNEVLVLLLVIVRGESSKDTSRLTAIRIVTELWLRMCPDQVHTQPVLQRMLQLLLSISSCLVKYIEPQVICQALGCVDAVIFQICQDEFTVSTLEFLSSLGKVSFPPDCQQQIVTQLSSLFGALLAESCWLLHQRGLEAFMEFAEITNHDNVMTDVIKLSLSAEETKTKVLNYLNKTINIQEAADARLERLQLERPIIEQHMERLETINKLVPVMSVAGNPAYAEPFPKRVRQETSAEEEYSHYVHTAERALKALQALKSGANPLTPPWLQARLQQLQTLLTEISTTHQHS